MKNKVLALRNDSEEECNVVNWNKVEELFTRKRLTKEGDNS